MADDFKILGGGVFRALRRHDGSVFVECEFLQCIGCLWMIRKEFVSGKDMACPVCNLELPSEETYCPTSSKQSSESSEKSRSTGSKGSSSRPPTASLN